MSNMKHLFKQMVFLTLLLIFPLLEIHAQITIHIKDKPASEVVKQIEKVSKYRFFYKKGLSGMTNLITIEANDQGIEAVMGQIIKQVPISYTIKGENQVVLSESGLSDTNADKKKSIEGVVTDTNDEPVIGANIVIKGSSKGTITDVDGKFVLEVPENAVLQVSYIGYEAQELKIGDKTVLNIRLQEDTQNLEEIVVVGYGTQTRSSLTSSITEIKGDQLTNLPVANISRAIDSYVPGLTVSGTHSETPGSSPTISIRGENSINNSAPLILIDGIEGSLNSVNPNDIASLSVLKDAASTAIYGSRAAGGVILITTKMGVKDDKIKISYSGSYSTRSAARLPEQIDGYNYTLMRNEAERAAGKVPWCDKPEILEALQNPAITEIPDPGRPTTHFIGTTAEVDHVAELMGSGNMHDHALSLTGGSKKLSFLLSGSFLQEDALFRYGDFGYKRYNLRSNLNFDYSENISMSARVSYMNLNDDKPVRGYNTELWQAYFMHPSDPVKWQTTGDWGGNNGGNAIHDLVEGGHTVTKNDRIELSLNLNVKLANGLIWNTIAGGYMVNSNINEDYKTIYRYSVKPDVVIGKMFDPAYKKRTSEKHLYRNLQSFMTYDKAIANHNMKVMVGFSYEDFSKDVVYGKREGYLNNNLMGSLDIATGDQYSGGNITEWGIASVFGRLNYNYKQKYFIEASFREDGSSRFVKEKRWGFFPSVSASWRISEEEFIEDFTLLSDLKLRASWGNTGNQNSIGLYDYIAQMHVGTNYYPLGVSTTQEKFISQTTLSSKERTWEKVEVKNIALDFGFFSNKLTGSFEYYIKNNKNMLVPVALPAVIGMNVPTFNSGELRVWGWEAILKWQEAIGKDFSYGVSFSLTDSKNEITKFERSKNIVSGQQNIEGYPLGSYFGYKTMGLFQSDDEVENYDVFQHVNTGAGDVKYVDLDGNKKIDSGDLTYLGNNKPRYVYNIGLNFKYKKFDLEMLFDGVGKKHLLLTDDLAAPIQYPRFKGQEDCWSPTNTDAFFPRLYQGASWNWWASDRTMHNAAYFACKNIQLGYSLPKSLLKKVKIEHARIYGNIRNPFVFDKYVDYLDPRLNSYNDYPVLKSYTIGLNLTF